MTATTTTTIINPSPSTSNDISYSHSKTPVESELERLKALVSEYENRTQSMEKEYLTLQKKYQQLELDYAELEHSYNELEKLNQDLQDSALSLTNKMEKEAKKRSECVAELERELTRSEHERRESTRALEILRQEFDTYRCRTTAELNELREALRNESDARRNTEKQITQFQMRIVKLEQEIEQLEQHKRILTAENDRLKSMNEHLTEELILTQTEVEEYRTHSTEQQRRLVEEINDLKAELFVYEHKSHPTGLLSFDPPSTANFSPPTTTTQNQNHNQNVSLDSLPSRVSSSLCCSHDTVLSIIDEALSRLKVSVLN
jgi:chromosome segregation ATPase